MKILLCTEKCNVQRGKNCLCAQPRKVITTNVKTIGASKSFPPDQHLPREHGFQTAASEHRVWMRSGTKDVKPNIFQDLKEREEGRWDKVCASLPETAANESHHQHFSVIQVTFGIINVVEALIIYQKISQDQNLQGLCWSVRDSPSVNKFMRDRSKSAAFPKDWFRDGENGETGVFSVCQDVFCDDGVSGSP